MREYVFGEAGYASCRNVTPSDHLEIGAFRGGGKKRDSPNAVGPIDCELRVC